MGEERGERRREKQECRRSLEQKEEQEEVGDKEDRGRDSSVSHAISPENYITSHFSERINKYCRLKSE